MILATLFLLQAAYPPETEAVMDRARREAAQARAAHASTHTDALSLYLSPEVAKEMQRCIDTAIDDPDKGIALARKWVDGGWSADQCLGFAQARKEDWVAAVTAFERAAESAQKAGARADAARLWAQAGNAALAGAMAAKARGAFDRALAEDGLPQGPARGEAYLDRARALVALGDPAGARADLDHALEQVPQDPLAWLLSATLARRMDDLARAAKDIVEAKRRAPDDASVALEAGKIAVLSGDDASARAEWNRVLALAPSGEQAAEAREMLARLDSAAGQSR